MNNSMKMSNTAKSTEGASKQAGSSSNVVKNSSIRLSEKQVRNLCISLYQSESEAEVIELLSNLGLWDDVNAWRNYGDSHNNFSTINNQQSQPEPALVEKIMNSIDSHLIAACRIAGIDPEGPNAPKSIKEAVANFLSVPEGNISCLGDKDVRILAEKIQLIATGTKASPNYTIFDSGEGQSAATMPVTLLSLNKSNKFSIKFVQGKFNMGGSGALQFCGDNGLQVIISKRHPELAKNDNDPTSSDWAVTVVRRFPPKGNEKSSSYRYLAPNQQILHFKADGLPFLPSAGSRPKPYVQDAIHGTFIKLFGYKVSASNKGPANLDLNYRLAQLMPELALPVKIVECRSGYKAHTLYAHLKGLKRRIENDVKNIASGFPASSKVSVNGDELDVSIIAFNQDADMKRWRSDEGVIFTVNGQKHGSLDYRFFGRKSVNKSYLKTNLLLLVDCSNINGLTHENLFMASRDRMRSGELLKSIENELEKLVKNHKGLRALNEEYRQAKIQNNISDSKPMAEVLQSVINNSPTIASLLGIGTRLSNPNKVDGSGTAQVYKGKRFPTFFNLVKAYSASNPKLCPKNNGKFRIHLKTDVRNDYFSRTIDKGTIKVKLGGALIKESANFSANLYNGVLTFNGVVPNNVNVKDLYHYEIEISDSTRTDPFVCDFHIEIGPDENKSTSSSDNRRKPSTNRKGKGNWNNSKLSLPDPVHVPKKNWGQHNNFNGNTALIIELNPKGGYDYFINEDNDALIKEQKHNHKVDPKVHFIRYKTLMTLIGLSCIKNVEDQEKLGKKAARSAEAMVEEATRLAASVLLGAIEPLAGLDIND